MGEWLDALKADPTPWLLEKACAPVRFRFLKEVHGRPDDDPDVAEAREQTYNYKPALTISTNQADDGTWFGSLVGFEAMNLQRKRGPGMASQYLALIEYGWGTDHPIVWRTSELLQALLWEDPSVDLCELKGYCGGDPAVEAYLRKMLSRVGLSLLSRAGFNDDIGVKRKSEEVLAELDAFYQGDVHDKLYVGEHVRTKETDEGEVEEHCAVVSPDAPLPDHAMFLLFAHNPMMRDSERGRDVLTRIVDYLFAHPLPEFHVVEVGGKIFDKDRDMLLRNLSREDYMSQKLVGRLLHDLEMLARWGQLQRVPKAVELFEWLVGLQDDEGVVRADEYIEKVVNRTDYSYFPLEDNWRGKHKKFTDVTFRLALIARLLAR